MKATLAAQVRAYMASQGSKFSAADMAVQVAQLQSGLWIKERCSRQNIENLLERNFKTVRYLVPLAAAMGTTAEVLIAGKFDAGTRHTPAGPSSSSSTGARASGRRGRRALRGDVPSSSARASFLGAAVSEPLTVNARISPNHMSRQIQRRGGQMPLPRLNHGAKASARSKAAAELAGNDSTDSPSPASDRTSRTLTDFLGAP